MELKRIYYNKKFILFILLALAINALLFLKEQIGDGRLEDLLEKKRIRTEFIGIFKKSDNIDDVVKLINSNIKENEVFLDLLYYKNLKMEHFEAYHNYGIYDEKMLRLSQPMLSKKFDNETSSLNEKNIILEQTILSDLLKQVEYLDSYPEYIEKIHKQAKQLNNISIFMNENSKRNIIKTDRDFSKLSNINVSIGIDQPITTITQYGMKHYILFIMMIAFVLQLVKERKIGIWTLVHSTKKGRTYLFFKRYFILFNGVFLITLLNYLSLFLMSGYLYGSTIYLDRNIQSIELFQGVTINISVFNFIILMIFYNTITLFLLALLLWFVISIMNNQEISWLFLGIFFSVEFIAYKWIPALSNWNIFKYLNLFYCINPTNIIIIYRNLILASGLIDLKIIFFLFNLILIAILSICCYIANTKRKPIKSNNIFFDKILLLSPNIKLDLSLISTELYKVLIHQKGIIILIALICLQLIGIQSKEEYYSNDEKIINQFYDEMGGIPDQRVYLYINELQNLLNDIDIEYRENVNLYESDRISEDEFNKGLMKYSGYEGQREALLKLQDQLNYLNSVKDEKSINAWLVNPRGYEYLFGNDSYGKQNKLAAEAVFCLILLISIIFSYDKKSGLFQLIYTLPKGRRPLFLTKLKSTIIITVFIWILIYGMELINANHYYKLSDLDAPLQSLQMFSNIKGEISIGFFIILVHLFRLALLFAVSFIISMVSCVIRDNSVFLCTLTLLGTSFLYMLGLSMFKAVSIVLPISTIEMLQGSLTVYHIIITVFMILSGILSIYISKILWCDKNRIARKSGKKA